MKKLYRSRRNRIIAGVCAGLAEYLQVNPTIVRLIYAVFTLFSMGAGILLYLLAWIMIPESL